MATVVVGLVTLMGGALLGYWARFSEFRRDHRLIAYGDFAGSFLMAAHAGAALESIYMQHGDSMFQEHAEASKPWWDAWGQAAEKFERATAGVWLIGSERVRAAAAELEDFFEANIRAAPPFSVGRDLSAWGYAIRQGPAMVDSEAVRLARVFADQANGELARWPPRKRSPTS